MKQPPHHDATGIGTGTGTGTGPTPSTAKHARERGAATVELALIFGLVLAVAFGIVQFSLDAFARQVAQAAANTALTEITIQNGQSDQAHQDAAAMLRQIDAIITAPQVSIRRTATTAMVTITGNADTVLGIPQHITVTAAGPIDHFPPAQPPAP